MDLKKIFSRKQSATATPEDIAAGIRAAQELLDDLERQRPSLLADLLESEESNSLDAIDRGNDALSRLTNRAAAHRQRIEEFWQVLKSALKDCLGQKISGLPENLGILEAERQKMLSEGVSDLAKAIFLINRYAGPDERAAIWANLPRQEMAVKLSEMTISKYPWRELFSDSMAQAQNDHREANTYWQRRGELMKLEAMIYNPMLQGQWIESEARRLVAQKEQGK